MTPLARGISVTVPILAATLTTSLLSPGSAGGNVRAGGQGRPAVGAQQKRAADPCERRWRPRNGAGSGTDAGSSRGLGRPAPSTAPERDSAGARGRPNIVTIMVDDMRADEMRGPWMRRTRKLIARKGATFKNSFAPYSLCGPARASFLTGQYSHNHRVRENTGPSAFKRLNDRRTFATWLDADGRGRDYHTAFLGKYINGYAKPGYVPPGWDTWHASLGGSTQNFRGTRLSDNGNGVIDLHGQYQTSAYGRMAGNLIGDLAERRKPFYLNVSFSAPHVGAPREPDDPPGMRTPVRLRKNRDLYEKRIKRPGGVRGEPCNKRKPRAVSGKHKVRRKLQRKVVTLRQQRAQALKTVDRQVQKIVRALRKSGELDNTYLLFTSDNGYYLGEFRQVAAKRLPYEPALRTPTLIRGPGIRHGIKRRAPFTSIDFAPTIADMANVAKRGPVDGVSMLPRATGRDRPWRRAILTDAGPHLGKSWYSRGVRAPGFFYGRYQDAHTRRELFDLRADPHQNHNVVGKPRYRKMSKRLKRTLRALRGCHGRTCRRHW